MVISFKVGTGIQTIGNCDAYITGERSQFNYGQKIWVLYRHGACVQLSSGNFKLYRNGILVHTYNFPSYWGYVYVNYYNWSAGSYKVVCTIGSVVMTKYFTIEQPTPTTGSMRITSSPTGASIYLNDSYKGITTKEIENLNPGIYNVKVTKAGYNDKTKSVTVYANQSTSVHFTLTQIVSTVTINVKECYTNISLRGAKVALDIGTKITDYNGQCVFTNIPVGQYISGSVSMEGYETRTIGWNSSLSVTSVTQCIPKIEVIEGKFQIISYSFPASAKKGQEVDGTVTVKNTGDKMAELRVKLIEVDTGNLINKEPDLYYKNVDPGQTVTINIGTTFKMISMPDHDWNLGVEAWRQI